MNVRGQRAARTTTVLLAVLASAAIVIAVAAAVLVGRAAPYLGPADVVLEPLVSAAFAACMLVVLATTAHRAGSAALLLVSVGVVAEPLALGLQQLSWAWVAVGAAATWTVPAATWVALVTSRGESTGRPGRVASALAGSVALGATVVMILVDDPAAWGWCRCVGNPFAVTPDPAVHDSLEPWLASADVAVVVIALAGFAIDSLGRPGRFGAADAVLAAALVVAGIAWLLRDQATVRHVGSVALLVLLACHLRGAARRRPSRAHVADLLLAAREESDPARLQELVARALGDPGAAVWWWDRDGAAYVDTYGDPSDPAQPAPDRVFRVGSDGRPIALVIGSRRLVADEAVLESVAEALRLSRENRRLAEELQESLDQVRESRSRIVTAGDEARQRIERDLHDGAQQLLISTGVKLNLASSHVDRSGDPELAETLDQASSELGRALAELRQLAGGITPTALVHGDLADALEELSLRSQVPVTVHLDRPEALPVDVGATVYFVVAEALTNVAKHAHATRVDVSVTLGSPVVVTVTDDGGGGADPTAGTGLRGLADRVDARGGELRVHSTPAGTTITATVPRTPEGQP